MDRSELDALDYEAIARRMNEVKTDYHKDKVFTPQDARSLAEGYCNLYKTLKGNTVDISSLPQILEEIVDGTLREALAKIMIK